MKIPYIKVISMIAISTALLSQSTYALTHEKPAEYTSTKSTLADITPNQALDRLIQGNKRFLGKNTIKRDLLSQKKLTGKQGQFPAALILSCMDSRSIPELILDQGVGDMFTVRLAGNVMDSDQLAGMEYATSVIGTKLIVIMGHTKCGAVQGACKNVTLGNLTQLLEKIKPAVDNIKEKQDGVMSCDDQRTIDMIAKQNVLNSINQVMQGSPLINDQINTHKVLLVGAIHHIDTGKVDFFDANGTDIN